MPRKSNILPWIRPWREWYQLECWRRKRRRHLATEPFCRKCLALGQVNLASIVDHVVEHQGDWLLFMNGELQSLCAFHHESSKRMGFDKSINADGTPSDPAHPVYAFERKRKHSPGRPG